MRAVSYHRFGADLASGEDGDRTSRVDVVNVREAERTTTRLIARSPAWSTAAVPSASNACRSSDVGS